MSGGVLILNGKPVPKRQHRHHRHCGQPQQPVPRSTPAANLRAAYSDAIRETLPNGRSYLTFDQIDGGPADDFAPVTVPAGQLFLMGDNRDDSLDSRFSLDEGGIGLVPTDQLVGRAAVALLVDRRQRVYWKPWTWFSALRWRPHRNELPAMSDLAAFLAAALGKAPRDLALYEQALTHGSAGKKTYERLEFLGDRVLGLAIAEWLYERFPDEPEGKMSRRYNALVARETCAEVGRAIGVQPHIRLGRQAREDHATDSDNVVGDVVEGLIGALYLDHGLDAASAFIRAHWAALSRQPEGARRSTPSRRFRSLPRRAELGRPGL